MDSERVQRYQQNIIRPQDLLPAPFKGKAEINLCSSNVISEDKQKFSNSNNMSYDGYDDDDNYNTFASYGPTK